MEPLKHHYIPEFYLKRWAAPGDNKLCEWQRHRGIVKPRRVYAAQTGYVDRLYELRDFPAHLAQQIESRFFQPVDSQAADAVAYMERNGSDAGWTDDLRSAWGRFLISLLLRCPEDLEKLRSVWEREILVVPDVLEKQFKRDAANDNHPSLRCLLGSLPQREFERPFYEGLISAMNSEQLGEFIINMHWTVLSVTSACRLYTSDRPMIMSRGLDHPDGYILVPIGPSRMFLAASSEDLIRRAEQGSRDNLTKFVNQQVVQHAVRFSYTEKDDCGRFIKNRMSTVYQTRLADRLSVARNLNL